MGRFLKYVFWLAVLAGIIYGGYYAYNNWWSAGAAKDIADQAATLGRDAGQKASELAKSAVSSTAATAGSFIKNQIGDLVNVIGEQLVSAGLGLTGATSTPASPTVSSTPPISAIAAGEVPAPTSSAYNVPPPPATIMISVNQPLNFSVNSGQVYSVDWGDGVKDSGSTGAGNITVLKHSWSSAGDYIVRMSVGNSVSSNTYSFPVRVY